ncbi:MAG: tetratricopeptide repeat protein, partial [Alkalinema sp. RU_4_3]|nr:tetratricopeptide repeat protein [Alkalinema sp. RU_4_3]
MGNVYNSLGQYQRAIDFHQQSLEIAREIGDRWGIGASLLNMAHAQAKLDNPGQALLNYQQAKSIYADLKLDHMVEQCDQAIYQCNQIIPAQRRLPPSIGNQPKSESPNDWYERERQANQRKPRTAQARAGNRSFYLWFALGLVVVLLVWWLKG